jgi:hypothetical protein
VPDLGARYVTESAGTLDGVAADAVFDPARTYRYRLTRIWGSSGTHATWIMLNPSTADALASDATIRRCIGFTKAWGLDGLIVVNLFALRATRPRRLQRVADPVGPDNDRWISGAIQPWSVVVAAWGAHKIATGRAEAVLRIVAGRASGVGCLGTTRDGHPRHPLYVPASTRLQPFRSMAGPLTIRVGQP